jgi:hypothetical protein
MKHHLLGLISLILFCVSCDPPELCGTSGNKKVTNATGRFYFDDRFDRYVLHHHVPGTIDSFNVFIFCDVSFLNDAEDFDDDIMTVSGVAGKLDNKLRPNTIIAGEEFFVIVNIEKLEPAVERI